MRQLPSRNLVVDDDTTCRRAATAAAYGSAVPRIYDIQPIDTVLATRQPLFTRCVLYPGMWSSTGNESAARLIRVGNTETAVGTMLLSTFPTTPRPIFLAISQGLHQNSFERIDFEFRLWPLFVNKLFVWHWQKMWSPAFLIFYDCVLCCYLANSVPRLLIYTTSVRRMTWSMHKLSILTIIYNSSLRSFIWHALITSIPSMFISFLPPRVTSRWKKIVFFTRNSKFTASLSFNDDCNSMIVDQSLDYLSLRSVCYPLYLAIADISPILCAIAHIDEGIISRRFI